MNGHPMRRKDREITDRAEQERILDAAAVLRLGLWDGEEPYVVPVNFVRLGNELYFHCASKGRKLDIIAGRPKVCFEAEGKNEVIVRDRGCDCTNHYESVIGWGKAAIISDPEAKTAALGAINKKFGASDGPFTPAMVERTAVVRIAIERMAGKANKPTD